MVPVHALNLFCGRRTRDLRPFAKKCFHTSRGLKSGNHLTRPITDMSICMRDLTGSKERVPWCRAEPLIANLHDKFALDHIEPFFLAPMDMERWATFHLPLGLEYRPCATVVLG